MKKIYNIAFFLCWGLLFIQTKAVGQFVLSTATGSTYWSTAATGITFGLYNGNADPVMITDIELSVSSAASGLSYELWYHPTDLTGVPTEVNTTNGWVYVASATGVTPPSSGIANVPVFTNLPGFMIPANATYRVAILASAGNGLYYLGSGASPDTYTSNGLSLYTQGNSISPTYVGYTTQTPYMANTPRGFCGNITFVNAANCSGQPSGGNATGASITCAGLPFSLNATGVSFGLGLEYQWESWDPGTSTWNAVPGATTVAYTHPGVSATTQFRLVTTCLNSGMSANSDTVTVNVTANLPGNTYTINPGQATG